MFYMVWTKHGGLLHVSRGEPTRERAGTTLCGKDWTNDGFVSSLWDREYKFTNEPVCVTCAKSLKQLLARLARMLKAYGVVA